MFSTNENQNQNQTHLVAIFSRALFGLHVILTILLLQHFKSDLKKKWELVTSINFSKEAYLINNKHSDFLCYKPFFFILLLELALRCLF